MGGLCPIVDNNETARLKLHQNDKENDKSPIEKVCWVKRYHLRIL